MVCKMLSEQKNLGIQPSLRVKAEYKESQHLRAGSDGYPKTGKEREQKYHPPLPFDLFRLL